MKNIVRLSLFIVCLWLSAAVQSVGGSGSDEILNQMQTPYQRYEFVKNIFEDSTLMEYHKKIIFKGHEENLFKALNVANTPPIKIESGEPLMENSPQRYDVTRELIESVKNRDFNTIISPLWKHQEGRLMEEWTKIYGNSTQVLQTTAQTSSNLNEETTASTPAIGGAPSSSDDTLVPTAENDDALKIPFTLDSEGRKIFKFSGIMGVPTLKQNFLDAFFQDTYKTYDNNGENKSAGVKALNKDVAGNLCNLENWKYVFNGDDDAIRVVADYQNNACKKLYSWGIEEFEPQNQANLYAKRSNDRATNVVKDATKIFKKLF